MPVFGPISHIDISASDGEASAQWYCDVLGLRRIRRDDFDGRFSILLKYDATGLFVGISQHDRDGRGDAPKFDERDPGLDHLAFEVSSREELESWEDQFRRHDVDFSPITADPSGVGYALVFRDPDNVQLELWWTRPR